MALPIALDYRPALLSATGIGRATRELARALAERDDVELHLFAHSLARARCREQPPAAARLHRLPIPGRCLPFLSRLGLGSDRLAGGAPVFHWTDYVQPPVSQAAAVLTVHDLAFVRDPSWHGTSSDTLRERTQAAIAQARAVVVPSQATAADVRAFAPGANVHVVPFGADHVRNAAQSPHPLGGRPYVLCLGTVEPRKNHAALLQAWSSLRGERPLLVVVGRIGWACDGIVASLREAAQRGVVDWRPDAGDDVVWPLLEHAQLLVYPSLWEGFGFPPLEAMQLGVPVIANDIAPLRELGDLAFVDAADAQALAEAIERTLRDDALRDRLRTAGRAAAARFRWRDCAAAHVAIYRKVRAW
ncbi:MAG TPA: glycosyltransferase family 1 protein [Planctomycetota bacterium]